MSGAIRHGARVMAVALAAALCGACGLGGIAGDSDPALPDDGEVGIHVITRGGEPDESIKWRFASEDHLDQWGIVGDLPEATCAIVGADWDLDVTSEMRRDHIDTLASVNSSDFSGRRIIYLAVDRLENGRVLAREGIPPWWDGRRDFCTFSPES